MINRIGVASLGLCISILAIRAVRAIVEIGRRCVVQSKVPSKDESEEQDEHEQQTTAAKQKKIGESVEDEEEVIFTSMLDVGGGSNEDTKEEMKELGKKNS